METIRSEIVFKGIPFKIRRPSLFEDERRSTNASPRKVNRYLDAIGNLDKRNPAVHPIVLTVEGHRPFDRA